MRPGAHPPAFRTHFFTTFALGVSIVGPGLPPTCRTHVLITSFYGMATVGPQPPQGPQVCMHGAGAPEKHARVHPGAQHIKPAHAFTVVPVLHGVGVWGPSHHKAPR